MNVTLKRYTIAADELAGEAAALCYKGKNPQRSLQIAMGGGHESVMEHTTFTFLIEGVSRVLLAQITRHRLASFSVESQRYCGANLDLVVPDSMVRPELVDGPYIDSKRTLELPWRGSKNQRVINVNRRGIDDATVFHS